VRVSSLSKNLKTMQNRSICKIDEKPFLTGDKIMRTTSQVILSVLNASTRYTFFQILQCHLGQKPNLCVALLPRSSYLGSLASRASSVGLYWINFGLQLGAVIHSLQLRVNSLSKSFWFERTYTQLVLLSRTTEACGFFLVRGN
jgi:hypothetical protein